MKVAIIGAGLSGLVCAAQLLEKGFEVQVLEKEWEVGGLAGYTLLNGLRFPKTYHHVLRSDRYLNEALRHFEIEVDWRTVNVGFYVNSQIFPFNGPVDLLRFSPLPFLDRIRLGRLVLNSKFDERLRDVAVKEWITSRAGQKVYENFVSPLISTYFGSSVDIAAAYLARRWSDESKYASNSLGYADFPKLIDSYVDAVVSRNGVIYTDYHIKNVTLEDKEVIIESEAEERYDAVVLTCPTPESIKLLKGVKPEVLSQLEAVEYRACICLAIRLEEKLLDYYWVNILDREMPFIACFEHGNLNPSLKGGLVYAVAYVSESGELWNSRDETVFERFQDGLEKISKSPLKVKNWTLFRASYGTPIYKVGYRNLVINPQPRLYFAGVYMAFPEIRSSGPAIRAGIESAAKVAHDLE